MSDKLYLAIHGHFYQPPRENPWTEKVELQKSAAPFPNWNERIHHECYLPNARARVLEPEGRIMDIVSNFEKINFDFGPTLLSWLRQEHPETYERIREADRKSRDAHGGHGNAIAQAHGHLILPLANRRDKVTQVRWGIADFRRHFGRDPEAMWLPETAVDEETLEVLVEAGMKYVILSPTQAVAVRSFGSEEWREVSKGQIDPKVAYRLALRKDPSRSIEVFFYDGPVSRAVGFDDLLFDARRFMSSIQGATLHDKHEHQLVTIATDGETFGHHKAFGDRVLAYLVNVEAPGRNFRVVNLGEYLEEHPPVSWVRLKEGEGTSWSCPHGVARWKDQCGCRGGGPGHWNQHWRKPLRAALDWLAEELGGIFEEKGRTLLRDVWEARDDYIRVVLDRTPQAAAAFAERHGARPFQPSEVTTVLKLLEMQRHALLMYTSCGWFFTEISGIETVQILQYAARALELGEELSGRALEEEFLKRLERAKSNIPEIGDGRGVWKRYVLPSRTGATKVLAHYGILSLFRDYGDRFRMGAFAVGSLYRRKESTTDLVASFGRAHVVFETTREEAEYLYVVLQFGVYDFRCSVRCAPAASECDRIERDFFGALHTGHVIELLRLMDENFGSQYYELKDIFLAEREEILTTLSREAIEKISRIQEELFDSTRRMNEIYRSINLPIPEEIRYAAAHTLSRRLLVAVQELAEDSYDPRKTQTVQHLLDMARKFDVEIKKTEIAAYLDAELAWRARRIASRPLEAEIARAINVEKLARKIGVELDKRSAQDDLLILLRRFAEDADFASSLAPGVIELVFQLASALDINPKRFLQKTPSPR